MYLSFSHLVRLAVMTGEHEIIRVIKFRHTLLLLSMAGNELSNSVTSSPPIISPPPNRSLLASSFMTASSPVAAKKSASSPSAALSRVKKSSFALATPEPLAPPLTSVSPANDIVNPRSSNSLSCEKGYERTHLHQSLLWRGNGLPLLLNVLESQ